MLNKQLASEVLKVGLATMDTVPKIVHNVYMLSVKQNKTYQWYNILSSTLEIEDM